MCTAVCAHREVFCWRDFLGLDVRVQSYVFFFGGEMVDVERGFGRVDFRMLKERFHCNIRSAGLLAIVAYNVN